MVARIDNFFEAPELSGESEITRYIQDIGDQIIRAKEQYPSEETAEHFLVEPYNQVDLINETDLYSFLIQSYFFNDFNEVCREFSVKGDEILKLGSTMPLLMQGPGSGTNSWSGNASEAAIAYVREAVLAMKTYQFNAKLYAALLLQSIYTNPAKGVISQSIELDPEAQSSFWQMQLKTVNSYITSRSELKLDQNEDGSNIGVEAGDEEGQENQPTIESIEEADDIESIKTVPGSHTSIEIVSDHYQTNDTLGYELYAASMEQFIRSAKTAYPFSIGVQAAWGQGKTSLMRMLQKRLDPEHPDFDKQNSRSFSGLLKGANLNVKSLLQALKGDAFKLKPASDGIKTVWFNAWKYQTSEEIWAGLAHTITNQLSVRLNDADIHKFWLARNLRKMDTNVIHRTLHKKLLDNLLPWLIFSLAITMLGAAYLASGAEFNEAGGGISIAAIAAAIIKWNNEAKQQGNLKVSELFPQLLAEPGYEENLGFLHHVEEDMVAVTDVLSSESNPIVVFVDDLDRCSPKQIAKVVEAMNLFLSGEFPNTVFVLGLDPEVVAAAIEEQHKTVIDRLDGKEKYSGWKFMDKFIQLPFIIPVNKNNTGLNFLSKQFNKAKSESKEEASEEETQKIEEFKESLSSVKDAEQLINVAINFQSENQDINFRQEAQSRASAEFSKVATGLLDDQQEAIINSFEELGDYLTDNPRCIKRIINLFRFHISCAFSRTIQDLPIATDKQIAKVCILIVRWPRGFRMCSEYVRNLGEESSKSLFKSLSDHLESINYKEKGKLNPEFYAFMMSFTDFPDLRDKGFW